MTPTDQLARRVAQSKTPTEWREEARRLHEEATHADCCGDEVAARELFKRAEKCAGWAELAERLERTNEDVTTG